VTLHVVFRFFFPEKQDYQVGARHRAPSCRKPQHSQTLKSRNGEEHSHGRSSSSIETKNPPHALVVNPQPIYSIFWCLAIHARLAGKRDSKRHTLECGGRGVHGACVHTNLARASHTTCDIPAAPPPSQQDPARRSHRPRERPPFLQLHRF
jgi:hypothetical protein